MIAVPAWIFWSAIIIAGIAILVLLGSLFMRLLGVGND